MKSIIKRESLLFYISIFLGVFIWFFFYIITPIEIKNRLSFHTVSFITLSYLALVLGFYFSPHLFRQEINKEESFKRKFVKNKHLILNILLLLILVSFVFRYFDLFYNRKVNFTNPIGLNKYNASKPQNFSVVFSLLSIFRVLYFVPLVFFLANKMKSKRILITCFFFLLPLLESYLRGSRRIIFESLGLLFVTLFFFKKINFNSVKTLAVITIITAVLSFFSLSVVKDRVPDKTDVFYTKIFDAQYNDLVPPKETAIKFIQENKNNMLSHACFLEIHTGQYITHGVFEMDHMISSKPKHTYGLFNFYLFVKFFNKLGILNIPLSKVSNPTKRITYITFFGGMFLDFGWLTIPLMFLFGVFQYKILLLGSSNYIFIPINIMFLFSNVFMLVFNFWRAQFVLSLTVHIMFIILLYVLFSRFIKKNSLMK